jgi:heme-binding protein
MKTGRFRAILLVLGFVLVAIQLVPLVRDNPPVTGPLADARAPVAASLRRACYNCHSHETRWPWYSYVAPASWLVLYDVHEGRRHLNFSEWTAYTAEQRTKKRALISTIVEQRDMPPWYYLPMHREARLSDDDVSAIVAWADGSE